MSLLVSTNSAPSIWGGSSAGVGLLQDGAPGGGRATREAVAVNAFLERHGSSGAPPTQIASALLSHLAGMAHGGCDASREAGLAFVDTGLMLRLARNAALLSRCLFLPAFSRARLLCLGLLCC
jgi:hypothetical protein